MLIYDLLCAQGDRRRRAALVALSTTAFMLAAFGFRAMNLSFTHDSTQIAQNTDAVWQISLGRFAQPVYLLLRGNLVMPWLIVLFAAFFLAHAAYAIICDLRMQSPLSAVLVCGLMAVSPTLVSTTATFINWMDIYMCALVLSVLAVHVCARPRWGFAAGAAMIALSAALYQAYVQCAAVFAILLLMRALLCGEDARAVFVRGVRYVLMLLCGLLLYALCLRAVLSATGIALSARQNGLAHIGDFGGLSLPNLLLDTWLLPLRRALSPVAHWPGLLRIAYILLGVFIVAASLLLARIRRLPLPSVALLILLLAMMPLGACFTYFIGRGVLIHELMLYSLVILLCAAPVLAGELQTAPVRALVRRAVHAAVALVMAAIIADSALLANEAALRRDLEDQSTRSLLVRVLDRIERTDGYVPGETQVAVIGNLYNSPVAFDRPGFVPRDVLYGADNNLALTYPETYSWYFSQLAGYPIALLSPWETEQLWQDTTIQAMPAYPDAGCIAMMDSLLVVKVSRLAIESH